VRRCLRKDPARRWQHMDDIKLILEDARAELDKVQPDPKERQPRMHRGALWAGAGLLLLLAGATALWWRQLPVRADPRVLPLSTYAGLEASPSFSPDGAQVAFSWTSGAGGDADIYVKVVDSNSPPLRITFSPADDLWPAWSPDGRYLAFVRSQFGKREILLASPLGGDERKLTDVPYAATGYDPPLTMAWSPDGKWLAVSRLDAPRRYGLSRKLACAVRG
jgi:WD40 repeat protein